MIAGGRDATETIATTFGIDYEPTTECYWCARTVPLIELHHLSVVEEPVDEDLIRVCSDCHPDKDVDNRGAGVIVEP